MKIPTVVVSAVLVGLLTIPMATGCPSHDDLGLWELVRRSDAVAIVRVTEVQRESSFDVARLQRIVAAAGVGLSGWIKEVSFDAALLLEDVARELETDFPVDQAYRAEVVAEEVLVGSLREREEVGFNLGIPFLPGERMVIFLERPAAGLLSGFSIGAWPLRDDLEAADLRSAVLTARALWESGNAENGKREWLVRAAMLPFARPLVARQLASSTWQERADGAIGRELSYELSSAQRADLASALISRPRADDSLSSLLHLLREHRSEELDRFALAIALALDEAGQDPTADMPSLACVVMARLGASFDCLDPVAGDVALSAWDDFRTEHETSFDLGEARHLVRSERTWQQGWLDRLRQHYL
ncbi:MAG: hypothetical protein AAF604_06420 [Acidobacteriota bacterium]